MKIGKRLKRKALAWLLIFAMVTSLLPMHVFAAETVDGTGKTVCVCTNRCTMDMVNTDCSVCSGAEEQPETVCNGIEYNAATSDDEQPADEQIIEEEPTDEQPTQDQTTEEQTTEESLEELVVQLSEDLQSLQECINALSYRG